MGAHTDLLYLPPAARTTSMLLPENRKFGPNPYSRDIIPEGIGRTTVRLWVGLPNIHPCYNLLPQVLCRGQSITCLSKAVSVSHKSQITCQNCAVGRLPRCSAAAFVQNRAWDGRQLPASPCWKENEVEIWRKPFK